MFVPPSSWRQDTLRFWRAGSTRLCTACWWCSPAACGHACGKSNPLCNLRYDLSGAMVPEIRRLARDPATWEGSQEAQRGFSDTCYRSWVLIKCSSRSSTSRRSRRRSRYTSSRRRSSSSRRRPSPFRSPHHFAGLGLPTASQYCWTRLSSAVLLRMQESAPKGTFEDSKAS